MLEVPRSECQANQSLLQSTTFILSSPRSGSTLLRVMLAGHSALFSPPELHLLSFSSMAERKRKLIKLFPVMGEGLQEALMQAMNLDAISSAAIIQNMEKNDLTTYDVYAFLLKKLKGRLLVDKTPSYAKDQHNLQRAEMIFEGAKYIHLVRHPYAVIQSYVRLRLEQLFKEKGDNPYRLAEQTWVRCNQNILEFFGLLEPERYYRIYYEDLVREPEKHLKLLCNFLQIPFLSQLLTPYEGERMTQGVSKTTRSIGDPGFLRHSGIDA